MGPVNRLLLCLIVMLLAACGSNSDSTDEKWESVSSDEGRFRAEFPVKPQRQTQRVPALGGSPLQLVVYTAEKDAEAVSVSYVDYPAEPAGDDLSSALDAAAESAASAIQGQNLTKRSTNFHGHEAIHFTVEADPQLVTGRVFMVGSRMYVLQVVGAKVARTGSFDRLASSFDLIEAATPSPAPSG